MVSSRLWNLLCGQIRQREPARPQSELLGALDWLQILDDLRDSTDALLKRKMNADGKAIQRGTCCKKSAIRGRPRMQMACFERSADNEQ
jgi:hypothetical protein